MGCASCASNGNGAPRGCKSNGTCGTDSCNKLTVFDWLGNMELPSGKKPFSIVEVRFKNSRKGFYQLPAGLAAHPLLVVSIKLVVEAGYRLIRG